MALFLTLRLTGDNWTVKERELLYRVLNRERVIAMTESEEVEIAKDDYKQNLRDFSFLVVENIFDPEVLLEVVREAQRVCNASLRYTLGTMPVGKSFAKYCRKKLSVKYDLNVNESTLPGVDTDDGELAIAMTGSEEVENAKDDYKQNLRDLVRETKRVCNASLRYTLETMSSVKYDLDVNESTLPGVDTDDGELAEPKKEPEEKEKTVNLFQELVRVCCENKVYWRSFNWVGLHGYKSEFWAINADELKKLLDVDVTVSDFFNKVDASLCVSYDKMAFTISSLAPRWCIIGAEAHPIKEGNNPHIFFIPDGSQQKHDI